MNPTEPLRNRHHVTTLEVPMAVHGDVRGRFHGHVHGGVHGSGQAFVTFAT